jgi:hypothetical protein
MSQELTSAAGTDRTSTHQAPGVSADDQAEIDFWTAALEEHSNRAMLNISRQALAKLLGIIGKLRTEQRETVSQEAPSMTAEHDADLAYYEEHVRGARRDSLNRSEWPALDAEIVRIKEVRRLVQRVISSASPLSEKDRLFVAGFQRFLMMEDVQFGSEDVSRLLRIIARLSASAPS